MCVVLCLVVALLGWAQSSTSLHGGQWQHAGDGNPNDVVQIGIQLKRNNMDTVKRIFESVSDPKSRHWRQFLDIAELRALVAPAEEQKQIVIDYLVAHNVVDYTFSKAGDFVSAKFSVSDLEEIVNLKMNRFVNIHNGRVIHRTTEAYDIPQELVGIVTAFSSVNDFPQAHLSSHTSNSRMLRERRAMEQHLGLIQEGTSGSTSCNAKAVYGYPQSSDEDLYSQVQVVCCNGGFTSDPSSPCSDNLPRLLSFEVQVSNNFTGETYSSATVNIEDLYCYNDGTSVTCQVPFTPLNPVDSYAQYNLMVTEMFENSTSEPASFPTALVTSAFVTPQLFQEYYDIPNGYYGQSDNNLQSVVEFDEQYYSPLDLQYFFGNTSIPSAPVNVVGPNDESNPGDEATLDIEWIMAVAQKVPTTFWSIGEPGYLLEWTSALLDSDTPPLVNSVSYAGDEMFMDKVWAQAVDENFMMLGTVGVSVVVASGDAGVTDIGHGWYTCGRFMPQYPASSPYVTTVSAVYFSPSSDPICTRQFYGKRMHCSPLEMGEVAVAADNGMDWTTGGGFSSFEPQPSWQTDAVNDYLTNYSYLLPPSSYFNASNRAYPDVSATGHNLLLILRGEIDIGDGTSAATPIFAGILSLLNDYLLLNNQSPLGFANPFLYQVAADYPQSFYDVTYGDNRCGDVLHPPYVACCEYGFQSAQGWDPVTGLGTPRFNAMLDALQKMM